MHPAKEVSKYDGPSKGPVLKAVEGGVREAKLVEKCCIMFGVLGEKSANPVEQRVALGF